MKLTVGRRKTAAISLPPAQIIRVYTGSGRKAHLMDTATGKTLCPIAPGPGGWKGTGSDEEQDFAAVIPVCRWCQEAHDARESG